MLQVAEDTPGLEGVKDLGVQLKLSFVLEVMDGEA